MKKTTIFSSTLLALCLIAFGLSSCQEKGPAEEAGEQIDEAVEEVNDEIDDATTN